MFRGFTLFELVVIMAIIGILAVFVAGRFTGQDSFEARGYFDELVSATRFAQRYAVSSGCTVRITISPSTYALSTQDATCGAGANVQSPAGGNFSGTAPAGGGTSLSFVITAGSGFVNTP